MKNVVFFYIMWLAWIVCILLIEAPAYTMRRRKANGGSEMLWAMFYWETLFSGMYKIVALTHTYNLNKPCSKYIPLRHQYILITVSSSKVAVNPPPLPFLNFLNSREASLLYLIL